MTGGRLRLLLLLLSVPEGNKRRERKEKREKRRKVAVYEPWQQLKVLVLGAACQRKQSLLTGCRRRRCSLSYKVD